MTLRNLLQTTKLGDVFTDTRAVVAFDHDETTGQVLETLSKHHILSAPIVVRQDGPSQADRAVLVRALMGFVSVEDFLHSYLAGLKAKQAASGWSENDLESVGTELCSQTAMSLFGKHATATSTCMLASDSDSCRDWGLKGNIQEPLLTVIRRGLLQSVGPLGAPPPHGRMAPSQVVHRLAVFDSRLGPPESSPHLLGIFSQMDAIRFLSKHAEALGHLGRQTLTQLGLVPGCSSMGLVVGQHSSPRGRGGGHFAKHHLVTVPQDMATIQAFQVLHELGVSGVAVVAPDGSLVGNLSVSDLRCLAPGLFAALLLPVREFLANRPLLVEVQRETSAEMMDVDSGSGASRRTNGPPVGLPAGRAAIMPPGVVTCQAVSTFAEVLALAARHSVHRVWVVDPDRRPLAAVTLTDMLRVVCRECDPPPAPAEP